MMVNMFISQINLSILPFVLICGLSLYTVQGKTVANLRQFRVRAVGTMFKVDSEILKEELKKRSIDGTVTGEGKICVSVHPSTYHPSIHQPTILNKPILSFNQLPLT